MRIPYEDNDISLSSVDHLLADIETVSTSLGTDYAAQIRLLLERAPQWISLNLIAAVFLAYALWAHVPNHLLAPWLVFMTATSALHVFLTNYFARAGSTVSQLPTRSKIHQFMIASNGLAWGIGIWFMLPALADDLRFAACAIVFGGDPCFHPQPGERLAYAHDIRLRSSDSPGCVARKPRRRVCSVDSTVVRVRCGGLDGGEELRCGRAQIIRCCV